VCARYEFIGTPEQLIEAFQVLREVEIVPRHDIRPTTQVVAIRQAPNGNRQADLLRWGLIPSWSKDTKAAATMINARGETVATKPSFRSAFKRRRCVLPATSFYEWEKLTAKDKQRWRIHRVDETPLAFAGLWEHWEKDGQVIDSCSIVTTEANGFMQRIHDRMPVILELDEVGAWLDPDNEALGELIRPCPEDCLTMETVPRFIGDRTGDGSEVAQPD